MAGLLARSVVSTASLGQPGLRCIATFVLARSPTADVRDLLWGAAGENPKNPQHASHAAHLPHGGPLAGRTRGAQREAELRGGAALSTREAVARCASRLIFRLAPGTPTTYAGAREQSSQARVVTEPHPPFKVVHVNRAWEQLCGWREAEVQGATMAILQGPDTDPRALAQVRDAAMACSRTLVSCINYRKDGSKFLNKLQVSPLYGADGQVSHLLGVLTPEELPAVAPAPAAAAAAPASDAARPRQAAGGVPRA